MRNLERRLEKLEAEAGLSGEGMFLVWFVDPVKAREGKPVPGKLLGLDIEGKKVMRPAGEDEEAFIARHSAAQLARLKAENKPPRAISMIGIRSWGDDGKS